LKDVGKATTVGVHYTSDMVHLGDLEDGSSQREDFGDLAKENCPMVNIVPFGRMDAVTTFADVKRALADHGPNRPGIIVIEVPQRMNGGATMSLGDIRACRELTEKLGVHMHLDGSGIFEAQPYYAHTLRELCENFDSAFIDFRKGLGGMGGAMLMGTSALIEEAVFWRQRLGGLQRSFFPTWFDCKGVFENASSGAQFEERFDRLCELVHTLHQDVFTVDEPVRFLPRIPNSCMVHVYLYGSPDDLNRVHDIAASISGVALWDQLRGPGFGYKFAQGQFVDEPWQYFEWRLGEHHDKLSDEEVVQAWTIFMDELRADRSHREQEAIAAAAALALQTGTPVGGTPSATELVGVPFWWNKSEGVPLVLAHHHKTRPRSGSQGSVGSATDSPARPAARVRDPTAVSPVSQGTAAPTNTGLVVAPTHTPVIEL
jgi:hypothetical protein